MLRYLLDEHISPEVARGVSASRARIPIVSLAKWQGGGYLGVNDRVLLRAAAEHSFTLVTYDLRTIPPLLYEWGQAGISHGGVVFVDERSIAPNDIGGLVRALAGLWESEKTFDWQDRLVTCGCNAHEAAASARHRRATAPKMRLIPRELAAERLTLDAKRLP